MGVDITDKLEQQAPAEQPAFPAAAPITEENPNE